MELEVTDINNDGRSDLIFASYLSTTGLYIYIQNETGTFNPYHTVPNIGAETSFFNGFGIGDLNEDGFKDIAISKLGNAPNSKIYLLYQNPVTHVFESPIIISACDIPEPVAIADLDNDGKNEIITIHGGFQRASVYQQNANGTYSNFRLFQTPYASHYAPEGLAIGDINNDNGKDIIGDTGSGLVVLYNTATLTTQNFNEDENTIRLFPNLATDFVNVDFGNRQFNNAKVSLYDITGKLLLREIYVNATNNKPLNIANLSFGLYLLVVTDGNSPIAVRKVIKK